MHPLTLVGALRDALPSDAIVVADGGDLLSFARVGLNPGMLLDPGSLGCLGVGTPFGIAASLASDRLVVVVTGDGALGFSAIELDTAARHHAPVMVVVANNGAWQIEVDDQIENFGQVVGTRLARSNYAGVASAFGLHAERIEAASDLPAAIARALDHRPSLLDVVVTSDARSADSMSGLARVPELQAVAAWDAAERALSEGAG
jgi:acetolactate synthase-1/2/3 large subunit